MRMRTEPHVIITDVLARITKKMESLKSSLTYFFPGDCYEEIIENYNILNVSCLTMLSSRVLSLGIILGSILVKVPQILKCLMARSVENISYTATFLELAAVTFACAYNHNKGFHFSSWGESFFIAVQVILLLTLMFYYNSHSAYLLLFAPSYAGIVWYLTSDVVTVEILGVLQTSGIPIMLLSRLSQVMTTYQNKATGQLSIITCTMNWLGTGARIFTTIQETQDMIILATFVTSFLMNTIILVQFLWYPAQPDKDKKQS